MNILSLHSISIAHQTNETRIQKKGNKLVAIKKTPLFPPPPHTFVDWTMAVVAHLQAAIIFFLREISSFLSLSLSYFTSHIPIPPATLSLTFCGRPSSVLASAVSLRCVQAPWKKRNTSTGAHMQVTTSHPKKEKKKRIPHYISCVNRWRRRRGRSWACAQLLFYCIA